MFFFVVVCVLRKIPSLSADLYTHKLFGSPLLVHKPFDDDDDDDDAAADESPLREESSERARKRAREQGDLRERCENASVLSTHTHAPVQMHTSAAPQTPTHTYATYRVVCARASIVLFLNYLRARARSGVCQRGAITSRRCGHTHAPHTRLGCSNRAIKRRCSCARTKDECVLICTAMNNLPQTQECVTPIGVRLKCVCV